MTAGQPRDHFGVRRIRPAVVAILALLFASPGPAHGKGKGSGSGGSVYVHGYIRSDGTYVAPHYRSAPDGDPTNNWSTKGNANPYTGEAGTKNQSPAAPLHYGGSHSPVPVPVPTPVPTPAPTGVEAVGWALPVDDDRPAQTARQPADYLDLLVDSDGKRPATGRQSERATAAAPNSPPARPRKPATTDQTPQPEQPLPSPDANAVAALRARQERNLRVCNIIKEMGHEIDNLEKYDVATIIQQTIPEFNDYDFTQIAERFRIIRCYEPHTRHFDSCTMGSLLRFRPEGRCMLPRR